MIEAAVILVILVAVVFALCRDRSDPPPAHMEGGGSHLRSERPSKRHP